MTSIATVFVILTRLIFAALWFWGIYIGWQVSWLAALLSTIPIFPTLYWAFKLAKIENGDLYISAFSATFGVGVISFIASGIFTVIASLLHREAK